MVIGKERHDLGRPDDQGYPVPRSPYSGVPLHPQLRARPLAGGKPRKISYPNGDNGPTKTLITFQFDAYYRLCFGKKTAEELYKVADDPDCIKNLAAESSLPGPEATAQDGDGKRA